MIVAHNMSAGNAARQLKISEYSKSKSIQKLSSGYRINAAADDAAGLSVSEKMREQIRGLRRASKNIMEGISLCQIADGALSETHDMLHRMTELSVYAANDTNCDSDREYIQEEIDQLKLEIDRIADTTNYNESIYPLKGKQESTITVVQGSSTHSGPLKNMSPATLLETTKEYIAKDIIDYDGFRYYPGDTFTITGITLENSEVVLNDNYYYEYEDGTKKLDYEWGSFSSLRLSDLKLDADNHVYFTSKKHGYDVYLLYSYSPSNVVEPLCIGYVDASGKGTLDQRLSVGDVKIYAEYDDSGEDDTEDESDTTTTVTVKSDPKPVHIQSGASSFQDIRIHTVDASAKNLGIQDLDVTTHENASWSIAMLQGAIASVSEYRSYFGTMQNRLEHAFDVNTINAENTEASESLLRDTDMAEETMNNARHDILQQTGQSMLAQANQGVQRILDILGEK